ncbi:hypothetical protein AMATHDRAFT_65692 [Amanita thiersii Skay4041]|uniref:Uncharacterized protein n=1 Tax=Amanita thiersii Skay4041 TaxID=703135 RepID=A0A2A9NJ84_9AGAR|nr:hypothetical protein AMATHDRAFT_65692 [Amanita thiersii Skay4041]
MLQRVSKIPVVMQENWLDEKNSDTNEDKEDLTTLAVLGTSFWPSWKFRCSGLSCWFRRCHHLGHLSHPRGVDYLLTRSVFKPSKDCLLYSRRPPSISTQPQLPT